MQLPRLYLEGWGKVREKSKLEKKQVDINHVAAYMRQTFVKTLSTIYHFILKVFRKQKEIFKI